MQNCGSSQGQGWTVISQEAARPLTEIECWDVINRACTEPQSFTDVWTDGVLRAYSSLSSESQRARAKAMLRKAISRFDEVSAADFVRELARCVKDRQRQDRASRSMKSDLPELENQIWTGEYNVSAAGIYTFNENGDEECICNQAIFPARRFAPIDTDGRECVEIKYLIGAEWQSAIVPRRILSDRKLLLELSERGIDATTENAGELIQFFRKVENLNEIPEMPGCGRFGWTDGGEFLPYVDGVTFTGQDSYRDIFAALHAEGEFETWRELVRGFYTEPGGSIPRIMLAASAAAPLIELTHGLPFFVHLWGASGKGKTLALMLAASVWGAPGAGSGLIHAFNATKVAMERLAQTMHNLPVCLDELGAKGALEQEVTEIIYMLAEGSGKPRGAIDGMRKVGKWSTVFITSGEQTLTTATTRAGAINRVISIPCNGRYIFGDERTSMAFAGVLKKNFGHAGRRLISTIRGMGGDALENMLQASTLLMREQAPTATQKQVLSAAYLHMADTLLQMAVFGDVLDDGDAKWLVSEMATNETVDLLPRALEWLDGWKVANGRHFFKIGDSADGCDVWGIQQRDGCWAYVISQLRTEMEKAGFSYDAFVSEAQAQNLLRKGSDGKTYIPCWFAGKTARCIVIEKPELGGEPSWIQALRREK